MLYPYRFQPLLAERIWGGQTLARFGKSLPPGRRIGESWEITDRANAQSAVINGPDAGHTLHDLVLRHGTHLLGTAAAGATRFPLLVKLIDACDRLSVQVHPPPAVASRFGGEPKTEMWYVMAAQPGAELIAGLRHGVSRAQFEQALRESPDRIADLVHRLPVRAGDSLFVPAGRLHAIGAGLVLAEIQQNSDTTYRVYDWGRRDERGQPRPVHIPEALAAIDFTDVEPALTPLPIRCPHFAVETLELSGPQTGTCDGTSFQILCCVTGRARVAGEQLAGGEFVLLPAALGDYALEPLGQPATLLKATLPTRA